MAIADSTKIDLLNKKLFGVAKTDTAANKSPANEIYSSPTLNRSDTSWLMSHEIPGIAPASNTDFITKVQGVKCTSADVVKVGGISPTWLTGLIDWIPVEFDQLLTTNSYRVKVYYAPDNTANPASSGTQVFADGSGNRGEWYFDYQAGILHFLGDIPIPLGMSSSSFIYIYGYRYVGPKSFKNYFIFNDLLTPVKKLTIKTDVLMLEDLTINGGDILTDQTTFNLLNTTASTINFAGDATNITIGKNSGIMTLRNPTVVGSEATQFLFDTVASTINFGGEATSINIGKMGSNGILTIRNDFVVLSGDLEIKGGDLTTNQSIFNLVNNTATTVNFAGAATVLDIGNTSDTSIINLNSTKDSTSSTTGGVVVDGGIGIAKNAYVGANLNVASNARVGGDLEIQGDDLTTNKTSFNLLNTTATTINFAGSATTVELGKNDSNTVVNINSTKDSTSSSTGGMVVDGGMGIAKNVYVGDNINVQNDARIGGDIQLSGKDLTVTQAEFNLANNVATTVNFAGAGTNINIGAQTGITTVNNNLVVDKDLTIKDDLNVQKNLDVDGDVNIDGGDLTVSTPEFNLANTTAKTVNFAGAATNIEIGSSEGDTSVNNNLRVDGIVDVNNSLFVEGQARINQSLEVEDDVKVQKQLEVEGNTKITKSLEVGGYIKGGMLVDTNIDCGTF